MKSSLGLAVLATVVGLSLGQGNTECTRDLAMTDDCADVINPNACYNEFRFTGRQTLQCIAGKDDADRARKACKCCTCVGTQMCNWVSQNNLCGQAGSG